MRSLFKLRYYARELTPLILVALLVMGITAALNVGSFTNTQGVFEKAFERLASNDHAQQTAAMQELLRRALILLVTICGAAISNCIALYMGDYIGQRTLVKLREAIFSHLQTLSMAFFERKRAGELISRVNNDTVVLQRALGTDLFKVVVAPLTVMALIVQMVRMSWTLALALGVVIPLVLGITSLMGRYTRRYALRTQEKIADLTSTTQESFATMRVIKTFGLEPQIQKRYGSEIRGVFGAEMKTARAKALAYAPVFGLIGVATCATLVLGGYEIMHGRFTPAALMTFLLMLEGAAAQLNSISRLYLQLQNAEAAAERTLQVMAEESDVKDAPDAIELDHVDGGITFDHVSFAYDGKHPVLHDFSLDIKPGEVVALAGPSGGGKSTVANLVPRLYDVQEGRVLIDGRDVREVKQRSLSRFMGMVPQETILFGTTIRDNIGFGREGATDDEIIAAAKAANAHDFIMDLPEGYDTQAGERGGRLSGGQKQRVAIARAFLRNPRVLILDEATSALDNESEKAIHSALKTLLQGRTALIIAHRLSTIQDADRIVVMADGRIVEQGPHEELLKHDGLYRRLYESAELVEQHQPETPGLEAATETFGDTDD
ncbi:MAG: ABC transporter ATP-binding protein [Armatimonadia bacterium]